MINTIFYYPNSKTEYDQQAGNISSRTISFVPDEKAIYKNGVRYGSPTADDLKNIFNGDSYATVKASKNAYGIVKVGDGIDVEDGVISVDFSNVDLSEIENDITSLKASVGLHTNAITDITGRISSAEAALATKASASDFTSLSNRIGSAESILTSLSASTSAHSRSITDLENRISTAETGLEAKANASSVYSKSEIDGKISTINSVISNLSGGADIDLSAITDLENEIATVKASLSSKADASSVYSKSYIDDKFSSVETTLSTLGANSGVDTSAITDLVNRISTAESTLQSKANASETYTKTEIDGKVSTLETSMETLGASGGISNAAITDLKNRMSSAETSISSKANASETYTKTEVDNKVTALTTRIDTLDASAGVDTSSITDLVNRIAAAETTLQSKADSSTVYTKTEIDGKITTINSSISANSGLKTAADVKSAFDDINETIYTSGTASATLFAKIESDADAKYAGIDVAVRKVNIGTSANPNYQLESGVTVSADNIDFTANNFTIDASKIDLRGEVILEQLSGTYVSGTSRPTKTNGTWQTNNYLGSVSFAPDDLTFIRQLSENDIRTTSIQPGYVTTNEVHCSSVYASSGLFVAAGNGHLSILNNNGNFSLLDPDTNYATVELKEVLFADGTNNAPYVKADSSNLRNVTVSGGNGLTANKITVGSGNTAVSVTSSTSGGRAYLDVDSDTYITGNLFANGDFAVMGDVKVNDHSGWSGTVTISDVTLTFEGGVLTNATGTGVTAAS